MYALVASWLDDILKQPVPAEVAALNFNLYEDGSNNWSLELVGTGSFDPEDTDWACDEVFDFGTRDEPLTWNEDRAWNEVLDEVAQAIRKYLEQGACAYILNSYQGVGIGFVDGDIEILFSK